PHGVAAGTAGPQSRASPDAGRRPMASGSDHDAPPAHHRRHAMAVRPRGDGVSPYASAHASPARVAGGPIRADPRLSPAGRENGLAGRRLWSRTGADVAPDTLGMAGGTPDAESRGRADAGASPMAS